MKETISSDRLYRSDYSREALTRYLEYTFTKYGIADKLGKAEYTILHESTWFWGADNGISKGLTQYVLATWLGNCSNKDDRTDPYKSIDCFTAMWSKGQEFQWDAYCLKYYDENCIKLRGIYPKNG